MGEKFAEVVVLSHKAVDPVSVALAFIYAADCSDLLLEDGCVAFELSVDVFELVVFLLDMESGFCFV